MEYQERGEDFPDELYVQSVVLRIRQAFGNKSQDELIKEIEEEREKEEQRLSSI